MQYANQTGKMPSKTFSWILLAGLAGGLAEVIWIGLYSALTPVNAGIVAREVTATVFPSLADSVLAPVFGLGIHFIVSLSIALAVAWVVWRPLERYNNAALSLLAVVGALVVDWAVNFFIVLPLVNPGFVALLPHPVSLVSKILFGLAMGVVLLQRSRDHYREPWGKIRAL